MTVPRWRTPAGRRPRRTRTRAAARDSRGEVVDPVAIEGGVNAEPPTIGSAEIVESVAVTPSAVGEDADDKAERKADLRRQWKIADEAVMTGRIWENVYRDVVTRIKAELRDQARISGGIAMTLKCTVDGSQRPRAFPSSRAPIAGSRYASSTGGWSRPTMPSMSQPRTKAGGCRKPCDRSSGCRNPPCTAGSAWTNVTQGRPSTPAGWTQRKRSERPHKHGRPNSRQARSRASRGELGERIRATAGPAAVSAAAGPAVGAAGSAVRGPAGTASTPAGPVPAPAGPVPAPAGPVPAPAGPVPAPAGLVSAAAVAAATAVAGQQWRQGTAAMIEVSVQPRHIVVGRRTRLAIRFTNTSQGMFRYRLQV